MNDSRPLGIFDSGLGGLTVVAAVRKLLPGENIVYLGDTARVPYGNRSPETIRLFAQQDIDFLLKKNVKAIIAACNTVSANALDRKDFPVPVCGVIEPGADAASAIPGAKRIVVLGTRATVRSDAYKKALLARDPALTVDQRFCPLFVPLVEEGLLEGNVVQSVFDLYLQDLQNDPPDAVLLGCTHYPLLKKALQQYLPESVTVVDSADAAALAVQSLLKQLDLAAPAEQKNGDLQIFATDIAGGFSEQAARFLGTECPVPRIGTLF